MCICAYNTILDWCLGNVVRFTWIDRFGRAHHAAQLAIHIYSAQSNEDKNKELYDTQNEDNKQEKKNTEKTHVYKFKLNENSIHC